MTPQQPSEQRRTTDVPMADPWRSFSYLMSGVLVYGLIGWLADRWLGTSFLVAIGILVGAGLGIYMTFARYNRASPGQAGDKPKT
ncbi:hypothetical protein RDV89_18600 [Nocardioides zeae]|uniref:AtpZ/AtpI family protein n=1 Tax=Nocardioides imazamoxiresistens TaxID=3231893 RepID=A0ABU3Q0V1_9ACTN|nr:hypothetical protein [Nocardioides zeae]MDT9595104.1 hypothetical protein [Nocardioides zeae]